VTLNAAGIVPTMPTIRSKEYERDGIVMRGRLALPDTDDALVPGVLVAHEANGLDDFQASRAEVLAELGYAAFALDYHGEGRVFDDPTELGAQLEDFGTDPARIRARAQAGLDVLLAEPRVDRTRVAAIGFCFGETVVMELARTGADLKAVVGFHPGLNLLRPGDSRNIRGKVLMCIGADDPIVPVQRRLAFEEDMRAAEVDWRMIVYGGVEHSFTHPRAAAAGMRGLKYDALAADRSWRAMLDLFTEAL
jgi:dienelactone hydrolase